MAKKEKLWTEGIWKGIPSYKCKKCPFDTLNLAVIEKHVKIHMPKPKPSIIAVVDKHGREVKDSNKEEMVINE